MRYFVSTWILLLLFLLPLSAQEVPAVSANQLPIDSLAADSEGDELDELEDLDDLDVKGSPLPECLAGLFSHDTLILGCDLEVLPRKIVVRTKDGDVVYKMAPQFMMNDTALLNNHPADSTSGRTSA